jgi:hypothetical protein
MATEKQRQAARKNIKKAQEPREEMSSAEQKQSQSQPQGKQRAKPGATGEGNYYHLEIRPRRDFKIFRTQDVGDKGHIQRVAGKRESGSWATVKWIISKDDAHIESGRLVGDTKEARDLLDKLGSDPVQQSGDQFKASDRPNVPEKDKPTPAQKSARTSNIKKAQRANQKKAA